MNNVELYLLLALLNRENYDKYRKYVNELEEPKNPLRKVLEIVDEIFSDSSKMGILPTELEQKFFIKRPFLPKAELEFYSQIFTKLATLQMSPESFQSLLVQVKGKATLIQIARTALENSEKENGYQRFKEITSDLFIRDEDPIRTLEEQESFVTTDLTILLENQLNAPGLEWRLNCLKESLGPLRKGDFGIVFARPETGKTTFLASELTFMLDQMQKDKPIIWFNNEEQGEKVMLRCFQAYFGITVDELESNQEKYRTLWNEKNDGKLCIHDSAIITLRDVTRIIERSTPGLVVFDQLDKIKGRPDDRRDLELGSLYSSIREFSKTYCPMIGICQAAASAENKMWLYMDDMADSKTSKPAEADFVLGIGKEHKSDTIRGLNISKNKLIGGPRTIPESRHGRFSVIINPEVARYEDI